MNIFSYFSRWFRPSGQKQTTDENIPGEPFDEVEIPGKDSEPVQPEPAAFLGSTKDKDNNKDNNTIESRDEKGTVPLLPPFPRVDKKGFPILTDDHDLYRLFGGKSEEKKGIDRAGEEDFDVFYRSIDKAVQESVLEEKKQGFQRSKPLSVGERVKAYPRPQEEIDLHGFTSAEAESGTNSFIRNARQKGILTVRIIVGKGLHSEKKAVLPDVVEAKLIELKRKKWVLDFKWEKKDKRKSGAVIVYIEPLYA